MRLLHPFYGIQKALKSKRSAFTIDKDYVSTLAELKQQVREAQLKAAISVNKKLIQLYWTIGKTIAEKQEKSGWGSNVIERLAHDLQKEFPGISGFSRANVFRMKAFFLAYEKVAQAVRQLDTLPVFQIPWGHNIVVLQKVKNEQERLWYAEKTIAYGWSRSALQDWIKSDVYHREGKAITNFSIKLPASQSKLAQETLKDPYCFDFLTLADDHHEKELEPGLIENIQKTLMELGQGFAFVARQVHIQVGESDFYIDLLFYHLKLRTFIVCELKNTPFKPEYAGKLNFYLSAVDDSMRHPEDRPTIGMLLCKTKDNFVVEYALRDVNKPMGVSGYETMLMDKLPKELKGSLPTVEEIERELEGDLQ